ncbi:sn-1-specific diacylglycerol lipase ABHD11-like isoform X2 [Dysidea avara]|uniref:sn-1-specific diacylglycerol lipase ABHD11-like isoform X2 n=1 Tax=Dysidea avara TaxID=196820 RepID=UPI00331F3BDB
MTVRLARMVFGNPNHQLLPVIILHGILGNKMNWRSIAVRLSNETGRQVYTLDARNHGDSPHTDDMSLELMCSDLVSFLNECDIPQCILIGHSMGGRTAMFTALQFNKLIESLVVVDVSPASAPSIGKGEIHQYIKAMRQMDLMNVVNKREADKMLSPLVPFILEVCERSRALGTL